MGVMHLWALLAGAAAIGVPLAVHWLTRPRPIKVNLSTLRFVAEAVRERRARHRLRDALILSARILAIVYLALAFARPLLSAASATDKAASVERVVVLDTSASMGAVAHGVPQIERARGTAARYLEQEPGLKANLVLAGARSRQVFERPSSNLGALREELGNAQPGPERLNLAGALAMAGDNFGAPPAGVTPPRREIVIVSDLQRANWGAADFSALPADAHILVESVAPAEPLANMAITDVALRGRAVAAGAGGGSGMAVPLEVEIANFSPEPRAARVQVSLDGRTYNLEKLCPSGLRTRLTAEVTFSNRGCIIGEAELLGADDALAMDNRRAFVVDVRAAPTYLLVTREGAQPRPTSSHYLERALAPGNPAGGGGRERVVRIATSALDPQALSEGDVVVLDRPGRLDGPAIRLLAGALRRGKSILYVAADPADVTNLGALALEAGGDLRMPVEFIPPAAGAGVGSGTRRNLKVADARQQDPVWAVFGDALQPTLNALRFTARLSSRPLEGGLADDILASYNDRSACLIATACGQGTLAVLNADLEESNIVTSGAFVPLIGELATRLLASRPGAVAEGGEAVALPLPSDAGNAADLQVEAPAGAEKEEPQRGRILEEHGALVWRLEKATHAGAYRITRGKQLVGAVAVAAPAEESDLATLPGDVIGGRLSGGREITVHAADLGKTGPDLAWVWLCCGAAAALLLEMIFLRAFKT